MDLNSTRDVPVTNLDQDLTIFTSENWCLWQKITATLGSLYLLALADANARHSNSQKQPEDSVCCFLHNLHKRLLHKLYLVLKTMEMSTDFQGKKAELVLQ